MPEPSAGAIRNRAVPRSVSSVLDDLDTELRTGQAEYFKPIPTRFSPLDAVLGGGLKPGDMTLVGGTPGVGKTIVTLQWARNMALDGNTVIYVCYEHEEAALLGRLLALEVGELPHRDDDWEMEQLRFGIQEVAAGSSGKGLKDILTSEGMLSRAFDRVSSYADNLFLVRASGAHTGVGELEDMLLERMSRANGPTVLFVDYLQKVSVRPEPPDESEKVTRITEALKEIALTHKVPLVSVVAADREGLKSKRLRLHHLRGSSALAYETDVALILNDKMKCISKVHLAYDALGAERHKNYAVFTVEKNRGGANLVDLEFRKDFLYYRFDPMGGVVQEQLVDERMDGEPS